MRIASALRRAELTGTVAAVLLAAGAAQSEPIPAAPQVGDLYQVTLTKDSAQRTSDGSSATAHDQDTIIERVIALRPDGSLELQYELPNDARKEERASEWRFPAKVLRPLGGAAQLLNVNELDTRIDRWLKNAGLSRADCGRWIFTWNAFRIECDPRSVLKTIQSYDLRSVDLHEGSAYQDSAASGPGILARTATGSEGGTYAVELTIDSEAVRRARAEQDVVVGEILKKPVSLEAALHRHEDEIITGTISIVFDVDPNGNARRRIKVTTLDIKSPGGRTETNSITETLERKLIAQHH